MYSADGERDDARAQSREEELASLASSLDHQTQCKGVERDSIRQL